MVFSHLEMPKAVQTVWTIETVWMGGDCVKVFDSLCVGKSELFLTRIKMRPKSYNQNNRCHCLYINKNMLACRLHPITEYII